MQLPWRKYQPEILGKCGINAAVCSIHNKSLMEECLGKLAWGFSVGLGHLDFQFKFLRRGRVVVSTDVRIDNHGPTCNKQAIQAMGQKPLPQGLQKIHRMGVLIYEILLAICYEPKIEISAADSSDVSCFSLRRQIHLVGQTRSCVSRESMFLGTSDPKPHQPITHRHRIYAAPKREAAATDMRSHTKNTMRNHSGEMRL